MGADSKLQRYREFEDMVFISQIIAIVLYIIFSKLFKGFVKYYNKKDLNDKYHKILWEKNEDFLEQTSYYMQIFTV